VEVLKKVTVFVFSSSFWVAAASPPPRPTAHPSLSQNVMYHRYPRVDKFACDAVPIGGGKGPTAAPRRGLGAASAPNATTTTLNLHAWTDGIALTPILPDLTSGGWRFKGRAAPLADGRAGPPGTVAFRRAVPTADSGYSHYIATYTMWVDAVTRAPVRLEALAPNLWTGGHFDLTVADFGDWKPGSLDAGHFEPPAGCPAKPQAGAVPASARAAVLPADRLAHALPNRHSGAPAYDAFLHHAGARRTRSADEYRERAAAHAAAAARVAAHDAPSTGYSIALTRMADMLPQEKEALVSQHPVQGGGGGALPGPRPGDALSTRTTRPLPSSVDWRGTAADSPVKDQAMCGSCWAFGTIGALEAAAWRASGAQTLFSEQHLVDCAWSPEAYAGKYPNAGCGGGYQTTAFDWVFARHGAVASRDYPYRGVGGLCDTKVKNAATFSGKYVWVGGGDDGLREALLAQGPMTVSVDASADDFPLYRSGVYNNTRCEERLSRLDHAVLISGYGVDAATGAAYWLVKNTWSALWGEGGYVRIAIRPDDCGISSQPLYLELEGYKAAA